MTTARFHGQVNFILALFKMFVPSFISSTGKIILFQRTATPTISSSEVLSNEKNCGRL